MDEYSPSVSDLRTFCRLAKTLGTSESPISMRRLASLLDIKPNTLCVIMKRLGKGAKLAFGREVTLIELSGKKVKGLTADGKRYFQVARDVVGAIDSLSNINGPQAREEFTLAMPNHLLAHLLYDPIVQFFNERRKNGEADVDLRIRSSGTSEFLRDLQRKSVDLAFDFGPDDLKLPSVERVDLKCPIDLVLVANPEHHTKAKLASYFDNIDRRNPDWLKPIFAKMKAKDVFVLDGFLSPEHVSNDQVAYPSFDTILSLVSIGRGIALVPGYYGRMMDFEARGRIVSVTADTGYTRLAAFRPKREKDAMADGLISHLTACGYVIANTDRKSIVSTVKLELGAIDIREFRFQYHLSVSDVNRQVPRWVMSRIEWDLCCGHSAEDADGGRLIRGILTTHTHSVYKLEGGIGRGLIHWSGVARDGTDHFRATVNSVSPDGNHAFGVWVGFDASGQPIAGCVILSPTQLDDVSFTRIDPARQMRMFLAGGVGLQQVATSIEHAENGEGASVENS